jgi:hypothetical protein
MGNKLEGNQLLVIVIVLIIHCCFNIFCFIMLFRSYDIDYWNLFLPCWRNFCGSTKYLLWHMNHLSSSCNFETKWSCYLDYKFYFADPHWLCLLEIMLCCMPHPCLLDWSKKTRLFGFRIVNVYGHLWDTSQRVINCYMFCRSALDNF